MSLSLPHSVNGRLACSSPKNIAPKTAPTVTKGMVSPRKGGELMVSQLVLPYGSWPAGTQVYFDAAAEKASWAIREYDLYGRKFILAPFDAVLLTGLPMESEVAAGEEIGKVVGIRPVAFPADMEQCLAARALQESQEAAERPIVP